MKLIIRASASLIISNETLFIIRPFQMFLSPTLSGQYFNKMHCCHGRRHDTTSSRSKCFVTYGHNIIPDMTLFTE